MTILMNQASSSRIDDDESFQAERFERFHYRQSGECPVRSHAARTRGRLRSRATAAYSRKMRTINGAHRRGRYTHLSPSY
jgi:hypothetical protein